MVEPEVRYEVEGRVATVTIDRPGRRNALGPATVAGLLDALERAETDDVGVVVLTGAGEEAFCAGGDLASGMTDGFLAAHEDRRAFGRLLVALRTGKRPVVARVNGQALGGGLGLVAACDLAVAADDVRFGTPEVRLGLFPWMIAAVLYRTLPAKAVNELVYTGERIDAGRALALGLVNRVVPRAQLDSAVTELAGRIADKSPAVLALGRRGLAVAQDLPLEAAVEFLAAQLSVNTLAEDAMEGVSAFLEKRPPAWKGR